MTIKQASELTGITVDNLRYYERIGLIPEVPRNSSGIRNYDEATLNWIDFVMILKRAGMGLDPIREYIQLAFQGEHTQPERKQILIEAKADLEKRMQQMQESLDLINHKIEIYDQRCESATMKMVDDWKTQNGNATFSVFSKK